MNLRTFLRWWLRGLRATAVTVDEALTQRRRLAEMDAAWERDAAAYEARIARVRDLVDRLAPPVPLSLEALWERPTVTPDLRGCTFVRAANDLAVADWLRFQWPEAWWKTDWEKVREVADKLLVLREAQIAGMVEL